MLEAFLQRVDRVRRDPTRITDRLRRPRRLVVGGYLPNRLGLQAARAIKERVAWSLRPFQVPAHVQPHLEALNRDGFLAIENFLPDEDFRALEKEVERLESAPQERFQVVQYGKNFVSKHIHVCKHPEEFPEFTRLLRNNDFIYDLAQAVSRRRSASYRSQVIVQWVYKPEPDEPYEDYDYNSYLHVDRHYRFMKAFFYLRDVPPECAPYTYVRGSHLFNWERLRFEYKLGVEQVLARKGVDAYHPDRKQRERVLREIAESLRDRLGLEEVRLPGKKNTLIISDNAGLHRRSEMLTGGPRVTANLDFKFFESIAHPLYPILRRWS